MKWLPGSLISALLRICIFQRLTSTAKKQQNLTISKINQNILISCSQLYTWRTQKASKSAYFPACSQWDSRDAVYATQAPTFILDASHRAKKRTHTPKKKFQSIFQHVVKHGNESNINCINESVGYPYPCIHPESYLKLS